MRQSTVGLIWRGGLVAAVAAVAVVLAVILFRDDDGGAADFAELQEKAGQWAAVQAKVDYLLTIKSPASTTASEWTIYWRPPDSRLDYSSVSGGESVKGSIITTGGSAYTCAVTGGDGSCTPGRAPGAPFPFIGFFFAPQSVNDALAALADLSPLKAKRDIAGADAVCYTVFGGRPDQQQRAEWCFSDDGVLLGILNSIEQGNGVTEIRFEATSLSRDVAEGDLVLPYPVKEAPSPAPSPVPSPSLAPPASPSPSP